MDALMNVIIWSCSVFLILTVLVSIWISCYIWHTDRVSRKRWAEVQARLRAI